MVIYLVRRFLHGFGGISKVGATGAELCFNPGIDDKKQKNSKIIQLNDIRT